MNMYMITLLLFLLCVIICVVKIKLANICIGRGIVHTQIIIMTVVGLISTVLFGISSLISLKCYLHKNIVTETERNKIIVKLKKSDKLDLETAETINNFNDRVENVQSFINKKLFINLGLSEVIENTISKETCKVKPIELESESN